MTDAHHRSLRRLDALFTLEMQEAFKRRAGQLESEISLCAAAHMTSFFERAARVIVENPNPSTWTPEQCFSVRVALHYAEREAS